MLKLKWGTAYNRPPRWLPGRRLGCRNFSRHDTIGPCPLRPGLAAFSTERNVPGRHPNDLLCHEYRSSHQPGTEGLSLQDWLSRCSASQVRLTLLKKRRCALKNSIKLALNLGGRLVCNTSIGSIITTLKTSNQRWNGLVTQTSKLSIIQVN